MNMKKKIILSSLIIGLIAAVLSVQVFAASAPVGQFLEQKQFVWVGSGVKPADLKPIALTGSLNQVLTQQEYAFSLAIEETINTLLKTKKASTAQVKQFFRDGINLPAKTELLDGNLILVQTGGDGVAEFETEKGRYLLQAASVAAVNLNLPSSVNINLDEYIIPVGINNKGQGTVKKIAGSAESLIKEAIAQGSAGNSKVKLAIFYDKNNNGKWDSDEEVAPWAGVRVDLVNLDKLASIELSDEWKDVYLDGLKKGTKASDLVNNMSQNCQTAGVSYIDGDTRKTFLKREGEIFGSDDFEITPGKVYSVRGCDIPFYIIGYDLKKQFEKINEQ